MIIQYYERMSMLYSIKPLTLVALVTLMADNYALSGEHYDQKAVTPHVHKEEKSSWLEQGYKRSTSWLEQKYTQGHTWCTNNPGKIIAGFAVLIALACGRVVIGSSYALPRIGYGFALPIMSDTDFREHVINKAGRASGENGVRKYSKFPQTFLSDITKLPKRLSPTQLQSLDLNETDCRWYLRQMNLIRDK